MTLSTCVFLNLSTRGQARKLYVFLDNKLRIIFFYN